MASDQGSLTKPLFSEYDSELRHACIFKKLHL